MLSVGFQMHLASDFNPLQLQGKYILRARGVGREQSGPDLLLQRWNIGNSGEKRDSGRE
jgi:hypothetical protein